MSRVQIPAQELAAFGGGDDDVSYTSGDASSDHYFENTGRELLIMKNADSGGHTATIASVADAFGRTGDKTVSPAAGKTAIYGPFPPALFNQSGGNQVFVSGTDFTSCSFAIVRINPS